MSRDSAAIGVSDHAGWAVLVTVAHDGSLLDRRRIVLVDEHLPSMPHHHEAKKLAIDDAVALVEQVRASAERHAKLAFDDLAAILPRHRLGLALRECQPLPATTAERIQNYRAQNVADWVMYRRALASAAALPGRGLGRLLERDLGVEARRVDHEALVCSATDLVHTVAGHDRE